MGFLGDIMSGFGDAVGGVYDNLAGPQKEAGRPTDGSYITGNVNGAPHDPKSDVNGKYLGEPGFLGSTDGTIRATDRPAQSQGFMAGMGMSPQLAGGLGKTMAPAPPPAWAWEPGKGTVWQTPERTINREGKDATSQNWKMTNSSSPWSGNRI